VRERIAEAVCDFLMLATTLLWGVFIGVNIHH
jgi:hypothetical protein